MGVGAGIGDGRAKSQPRRGVISIAGGHAPGNRAPSPPAPSPRWRGEGCRRRGVGSCPGVSPPATEIAALRGAGQPRPLACHPDLPRACLTTVNEPRFNRLQRVLK